MTSITHQKSEHKEAIVDLLRERYRYYAEHEPENVESLVVSLGAAAMESMTLEKLEEWHAHLESLIEREE